MSLHDVNIRMMGIRSTVVPATLEIVLRTLTSRATEPFRRTKALHERVRAKLDAELRVAVDVNLTKAERV